MPRGWKPCSTPTCATVVPPGTGRCDQCRARANTARGTAAQRGYDAAHRRRFRRAVLERDVICVMCRAALATHADHHPLGRDELVAQGLDPNDPRYGRGLCPSCDSDQTTARQPGGWHAEQR